MGRSMAVALLRADRLRLTPCGSLARRAVRNDIRDEEADDCGRVVVCALLLACADKLVRSWRCSRFRSAAIARTICAAKLCTVIGAAPLPNSQPDALQLLVDTVVDADDCRGGVLRLLRPAVSELLLVLCVAGQTLPDACSAVVRRSACRSSTSNSSMQPSSHSISRETESSTSVDPFGSCCGACVQRARKLTS